MMLNYKVILLVIIFFFFNCSVELDNMITPNFEVLKLSIFWIPNMQKIAKCYIEGVREPRTEEPI